MPVLHALGTGTCFPEPGSIRRAHPGFLLTWGENEKHNLLLECSSSIAERLERVGVSPDEIKAVAISHAHPDHFALPQFVQSAHCATLQRGERRIFDHDSQNLDLFVPQHIANHIDTLNRIHFEESCGEGRIPGLQTPKLHPNVLDPGATGVFMDAIIRSFRVMHGFGRVDALAFRIALPHGEALCYSGDSGECDGLRRAAEGVNLFICEASARVGDEDSATAYGHLNPRQAASVAKEAGARHLVLTHYSGADSEEDMLADARKSGYTGEITIARDGDTFSF